MYAQKTFLALKNPYSSVDEVHPAILADFGRIMEDEDVRYVGVKNRVQIPPTLMSKLRKGGSYRLHTLDVASHGGRAIDIFLRNPVTGRPMTGSSSGTAINVRIGINDIGIGTDGGGSVLAPALCLNLYACISPLIESEWLSRFSRTSTDGISFRPSVGFITRDYDELLRVVSCVLDLDMADMEKNTREMASVFPVPESSDTSDRDGSSVLVMESFAKEKFHSLSCPDVYDSRMPLIEFLKDVLPTCDAIIAHEGPVDVAGFGDSVFGHWDARTRILQRAGKKGLLRVVTMAGASAIAVPSHEFASGIVLICESTPEKIARMLCAARLFVVPEDDMTALYISNPAHYFPVGFNDVSEDYFIPAGERK